LPDSLLRGLFGPHENCGPDSLRAGVSAPDTPEKGCDKEQKKRGDHEEPGKQGKILRPEGQEENMKLALRHIKQYRLMTIPG